MTNRLLRTLAAAAALSPAWLAAQQPAWIATPGASPQTMRLNRPPGQEGPVTDRPFSATEVRHTMQTLADGSHVNQSETSYFSRDALGRMRTANEKIVVIFDPVGGATYTLNVPTKTYTKAPLSGREATYSIAVAGDRVSTAWSSKQNGSATLIQPRDAAAGTQVEEDLPAKMISGMLAKGSRVTITIPAGTFGNDRDLKVVNERWYSDDMRILLQSSNSDPRFGTTTYELTNLISAPPDPTLFQVPADYRASASITFPHE